MKYVQENGQILINFLPNFWLLRKFRHYEWIELLHPYAFQVLIIIQRNAATA